MPKNSAVVIVGTPQQAMGEASGNIALNPCKRRQWLTRQSCDRDYDTGKESTEAAENRISSILVMLFQEKPRQGMSRGPKSMRKKSSPTKRVLDAPTRNAALFQRYCVGRRIWFRRALNLRTDARSRDGGIRCEQAARGTLRPGLDR